MTIRPAAAADWPAVGTLAAELVRAHHAFDRSRFFHPDKLRADVYTSHLRQEIDHGHAVVLVADVNGEIAGYVFAGIEPESWKELRYEAGYVHDLVVEERFRHRGLGRALIESAVNWFGARNITRVMLWSAAQNADAQKLFRRVGFRPTMIEMTLDQRTPTEEP